MPQARVLPFLDSRDPLAPSVQPSHLVVQVGRDLELSRLRARVISSAGFFVRSLAPNDLASELKAPYCARVWIFCHTLEFYEHALLATAIRRTSPLDKLLRLNGMSRVIQAAGLFDLSLDPSETVDTLLRVLTDLTRRVAG